MDGASTSIYAWPQVLTMNQATMNKIHEYHYKVNDPLGWKSERSDGSLIGTQTHHGKFTFNPDPGELPVNEVLGYTFTLSNGTITLGKPSKDMTFKKWTFILYVVPEQAESYGKVEGYTYYYGIDLKTTTSVSSLQFAPNTKQDPDPATLEKKAGWASGTIDKFIKKELIAGLQSPQKISFGLSIGCQSQSSGPGYCLTPRSFVPLATMQGDPSKRAPAQTPCYFAVHVVTDDLGGGRYDALKGEVFNLSGQTSKLTIGWDRFWNGWFLQAIRPVMKDLQVYPNALSNPGDNSYRIGYNPDHPDIDDKFYDFKLHYSQHDEMFCAFLDLKCGTLGDGHATDMCVSILADSKGSRINIYIDWILGEENVLWTFGCAVVYGVTQFSTETGGITIEQEGDIQYTKMRTYATEPNKAVNALESQIDSQFPSIFDDFLESLQTIDKFYDLGFDRFVAVNPVFEGGNLLIDMNINGVDDSGDLVRQKPLPAQDAKGTYAKHREIINTWKELNNRQ